MSIVSSNCSRKQRSFASIHTHEHGVFSGGIQNLIQLDNVIVVQLFQDGNLSSNQFQRCIAVICRCCGSTSSPWPKFEQIRATLFLAEL